MRKVLSILTGAALIAGCSPSKQRNVQDGDGTAGLDSIVADSAAMSLSYDSLVAVESRAAVDTAYASSEEYRQCHAVYDEVVAQLTAGMDESELALFQLKNAVTAYYNAGKHYSSSPEEMRNPQNQERMKLYVKKAKELKEQLMASHPTQEQLRQLDSISKTVHF